jgi:hypothetical protein
MRWVYRVGSYTKPYGAEVEVGFSFQTSRRRRRR